MQADWTQCDARILVYEGGKVDNSKDPGGRTNQGITQATYNAYRREKGKPSVDVYLMTNDERDDIYKTHYWNAIQGDDLPAGVDLAVYDPAVNSGPGHAIIWLQQALGVEADGQLGVHTLQAIEDADHTALIEGICSRRLGSLQKLSTWKTFGAGWHARIANVQKASIALEGAGTAPHAVDVSSLGGHTKAPIVIPQSKTARIVANSTAVVTGAGTVASQVAAQLEPVQVQFPHWHWLQAAVGALTATAGLIAVGNHVADSTKKLALLGARTATVDIDADLGLPQVPVSAV